MIKTLAKFTCRNGYLKSSAKTCLQRRFLNIHENQAYTVLREGGIPTPEFGVAKSADEAAEIARKLDTRDLVLKAQVLTGGRGKGFFKGTTISGVILCETPEEAKEYCSHMIGNTLVTKQTGPEGKPCHSVMITRRVYARKEMYLCIMMERSFGGPVVIASRYGGVNIEETAQSYPDSLIYVPIDITKGLSSEDADKVARTFKLPEGDVDVVKDIVSKLYNVFVKRDATLLEINPLAEDLNGKYLAMDCKCNLDDYTDFRQKDIFDARDWAQKSENESRAEKMGLNYIPLDGNIGCMVNGAGLAMATMDIIKFHGGNPANFLDLGGQASEQSVKEALMIVASDPKVETIFVNIFAGINRGDTIAQGIVNFFKESQFDVPIVVRLQGNHSKEGRKLILDANLKIIPIEDFDEAAKGVTDLAEICRIAKGYKLDIVLNPLKKIKV